MTATTIRVQMAQRKDTAANWTAANPILLSGEIGYETDNKKFKIGNGSTNWNNLAYLPIPDGSGNLTITGNLEIGNTGSLTFEGSTADGFETTLAVTNPTADRTITLPNQSGTVLVSGNASIVDADISATAEIAVSKLADGTARQLLQTDAAGTGVEWASNIDIPGTLDVTGAATFDAAVSVPLGSAALPSLTFTGDLNTGIYSPGADQVAISTSGTGRIVVGSTGTVNIVGAGSAGSTQAVSFNGSAPVDSLVLTSGGLVGIGTSSPSEVIHVVGNGRVGNNTTNPTFTVVSSNTSNPGANTRVGTIKFAANANNVADITAERNCGITATTGSDERLTNLDFYTSTVGGGAARVRIDSSGNVTIGSDGNTTLFNQASVTGAVIEKAGAMQLARSGDQSLLINRISDDGTLVGFYQDGTQEGSISVSGSTVSYNGAHLSRWSQLPSGAERTEILRGSVLSNIDEMCEWGNEDNEQLNRMKVSDVEGDKNVSGVFQAWDDDDDTYTNDFYCAMTGDFIIRIAQGVTVERGDLLMSAGDGTAKPQDDDIIRSKTIAKVTSTNVSCTYEDGSYCVPCVLMAC